MEPTPNTPPTPPVDAKAGVPPAVKQDVTPADPEFDLGGEKIKLSEFKRRSELAKGAQKALQDVDSLKKNYSNFLAGFKSDPVGVIRNMVAQGVISKEEAVKLATEAYRENVYNPSKLSKEQLEAQEAKRELEALKKEKQDREAAAQKSEAERKALELKRYVAGQLKAAFEKHKDIPESAETIRFAAKHMKIAKDAGHPISYEDAVLRGWNELKEWNKRIVALHNEDNVLDYVGEELAEKINKAYLKKLKAKEKAAEKSQGTLPVTKAPEGNKPNGRPMSRRERVEAAAKATAERIMNLHQGR